MHLQTTRFGVVEVPEDTVYMFPEAIPGFPRFHRYAILHAARCEPFQWLQCLEDPDLAFVLIDPLLFRPDYLVEMTAEEARSIEIEDLTAGFVRVIVTVPPDPRDMTANLRAPLVFNPPRQLARQLILSRTELPVRYRMFEATPPGAVATESAKS